MSRGVVTPKTWRGKAKVKASGNMARGGEMKKKELADDESDLATATGVQSGFVVPRHPKG